MSQWRAVYQTSGLGKRGPWTKVETKTGSRAEVARYMDRLWSTGRVDWARVEEVK